MLSWWSLLRSWDEDDDDDDDDECVVPELLSMGGTTRESVKVADRRRRSNET